MSIKFFELNQEEMILYRNEYLVNKALRIGFENGLSKEEVYFKVMSHLLSVQNEYMQSKIDELAYSTTPIDFILQRN